MNFICKLLLNVAAAGWNLFVWAMCLIIPSLTVLVARLLWFCRFFVLGSIMVFYPDSLRSAALWLLEFAEQIKAFYDNLEHLKAQSYNPFYFPQLEEVVVEEDPFASLRQEHPNCVLEVTPLQLFNTQSKDNLVLFYLWLLCAFFVFNVALLSRLCVLLAKGPKVIRVPIYLKDKIKTVKIDSKPRYCMESTKAGSQPMVSPGPDFICEVWCETDGVKTRQATAFRVGDRLYTAAHTLIGADRVWLRYKGKEFEIMNFQEKFISIDFDVISCVFPGQSYLGMGAGKFVALSTRVCCQIHNGTSGTMGHLIDTLIPGDMEFTGTTLINYSGAPYFNGRLVYGMHLGSGVVNSGIDGALIHALLKRTKLESASEFTTDPEGSLEREFDMNEGKVEFRRMANDYYTVKINNSYRVFDEETFENVYKRWETREVYPSRYQPESVNAAELALLKKRNTNPFLEDEPKQVFTYQDSENIIWPTVAVTQAVGPAQVENPEPAIEKSPLVTKQTVSTPPAIPPRKTTVGQKVEAAQEKLLSRITLCDLKLFVSVFQAIKPSKLELEAIRKLAMCMDPLVHESIPPA